MKTIVVLVSALVIAFAAGHPAFAQAPPQKPPAATTPPPAQQPPPGQKPATPAPAAPRRAAAPAARGTMTVFVTDSTGAPVQGVQVKVSGPVPREGVTSREGTVKLLGLRPGDYRLHLEADGFVTLEKDLTVRGGTMETEVSLTRAPAPKPVEPPPAAKPAPTGAAALPPPDANATIQVLTLPDWIEKNYIGRSDPQKDTAVGRTSTAAATVLQVRDPIKDRTHDDADEMLYVIAGEGVLHAKGRDLTLDAGTLAIIPRGAPYGVERRGKNPLIALSILSRPIGQ